MKITFLEARHGDCIHISHRGRNIIIDSGTPGSDVFMPLLREIESRGERVNLLVITHYDYDHIGGVVRMDPAFVRLIDRVWFNSSLTFTAIEEKEGYLSLRQAARVKGLLKAHNVEWDRHLTRGKELDLGDGWKLRILFGGVEHTSFSAGEFLATPKCDWGTKFSELESYLSDAAQDLSPVNASSIVLLLTDGTHNYLFPGDSTPALLLQALADYSPERPLELELLKLPHHGSSKNITRELLERIICSDFAVLTNGDVHYHPNKKMMLKVLKWGRRRSETVRFHLNYHDCLRPKLNITAEELEKYKFELDGEKEFEA